MITQATSWMDGLTLACSPNPKDAVNLHRIFVARDRALEFIYVTLATMWGIAILKRRDAALSNLTKEMSFWRQETVQEL